MILRELSARYIPELSQKLESLSDKDKEFFKPHEFDTRTLFNLLNDGNHYYVAIEYRVIVGYGMLRTGFMNGEQYPNPTLGIAIWEKYRGKGKSIKILNLLVKKAIELGFSNVRLKVHKNNESAFRAYEKVGFRIIGENKDKGSWWMQYNIINQTDNPEAGRWETPR
jgi:RimJ/RimL family protein N-acetyltransferase